MTDVFTKAERSRVMSRIRGRDTKPELLVRSAIHRAGLRYSLQRRDLPGRPDVVLEPIRTAIFVHGCFWHGHRGCRFAVWPRSNAAFWRQKISATRKRDGAASRALTKRGWSVETIWECEIGGTLVPSLVRRLVRARLHARSGQHAAP